jgi:two-component system chemotaxis sensor kinase CheA
VNPLLEQFLSEARDFLQGIGDKLMQLEKAPDDADLMTELFRFVHTLKGNSGLFDFPEMTRVLHAAEDLMDAVRRGRVAYSQELADRLLDAMDFVGMLCDEIEMDGSIGASYSADSARLTESLRHLIAGVEGAIVARSGEIAASRACAEQDSAASVEAAEAIELPLTSIPEATRRAAYRCARDGKSLHWLIHTPLEDCFFNGEDPFFQARTTPEGLWGDIVAREPWPKLRQMDAYRCVLDFHLLTSASRAELDEHCRYVSAQVRIYPLSASMVVFPQGDCSGGATYEEFAVEALNALCASDIEGLARIAQVLLQQLNPDLRVASALRWLLLLIECEPANHVALCAILESLRSPTPIDSRLPATSPSRDAGNATEPAASRPSAPAASFEIDLSSEESAALLTIVANQREILSLPIEATWQLGRIKASSLALTGCLRAGGHAEQIPQLESATAIALDAASAEPLLAWLDTHFRNPTAAAEASRSAAPLENSPPPPASSADDPKKASEAEEEVKFGRRADDAVGPKSLKVDQVKIDRLMNLIGEIVVAKNALPYLAGRAESVFGVRDLSREIKAQYAVINRIAEEMQDAIMQVRMMPVSFVFQRFPRLVRDISRKLGKEVNLVLEGEETEADKNIIESLGDPLVHIVRNSLDHGFELPEVRRAAGKPATGTLAIRATQESDRVVIEIQDDGKGIDPAVVKRKAYERGLIDEAALERISDKEAVNLVFAAGFSTVEVISDLSGRGVGMDVVRTAVEKVNGTIELESEKGKGTRLRLSLPLSMAVTNVMIVESDGQIFGMPMDCVVETVRVPRADIRTIKKALTTVLRGRIVPLKSLNGLLGLSAPPISNDQDELAVLVVRRGDDAVGLLVDDFRETVDIILKPLSGVLAGLGAYSGSALMGDGSVLMVLNVKELL